ncbi:MAG TPA: hypothetical protein VFC41_01155 [Anaerovoracaceae bacterium]|nr:hypothetical protein [Anaerovoracaceae bacterium]
MMEYCSIVARCILYDEHLIGGLEFDNPFRKFRLHMLKPASAGAKTNDNEGRKPGTVKKTFSTQDVRNVATKHVMIGIPY